MVSETRGLLEAKGNVMPTGMWPDLTPHRGRGGAACPLPAAPPLLTELASQPPCSVTWAAPSTG